MELHLLEKEGYRQHQHEFQVYISNLLQTDWQPSGLNGEYVVGDLTVASHGKIIVLKDESLIAQEAYMWAHYCFNYASI